MRARLRPYYSDTGRPSVDPEVLLRILLIGYLYGITSERRLVEEVGMHLAYRWFTGIGFDQAQAHGTFSWSGCYPVRRISSPPWQLRKHHSVQATRQLVAKGPAPLRLIGAASGRQESASTKINARTLLCDWRKQPNAQAAPLMAPRDTRPSSRSPF